MSLLQQNANVIRRSNKTDFTTANHGNGSLTNAGVLSRERSFVKQSNLHKRRSQTISSLKALNKPTMEIYRPPNVRSDLLPALQHHHGNHGNHGNGKLNVHAKEFTMQQTHELQQSKSSGNLSHYLNYNPNLTGDIIQQKSSLRQLPLIMPGMMSNPLMHSATSIIVPNAHRVNFQIPEYTTQARGHSPQNPQGFNASMGLKRSKSMIETQPNRIKCFNNEEIDLGSFSEEDRTNLKLALEDPNALQSRTLMDLVKLILERVVEGIKYSEAGAKLCIRIIDAERNQTFLESLINTCQQWYQERDKILRGQKAGDGTRFTAFMWFLTEMCGQLKRHQMKSQFEALQPDMVLLSVLGKCCMACVSLPIKCLAETECLFFVLTSIGRDLENELPLQLDTLMASVRDGFLASAGSPAVRRTLLQLIELHASKWQLPGSSVLYYYPRAK
ncbi:CBP80/20-dependent translation initiation factor [Atheta coriaria]|uniref:CBP80/20-dependent translation initiation factor n=1 Tax=Dalotia coriaria TaxID=877792 RepID=UPI0031F3ED01